MLNGEGLLSEINATKMIRVGMGNGIHILWEMGLKICFLQYKDEEKYLRISRKLHI